MKNKFITLLGALLCAGTEFAQAGELVDIAIVSRATAQGLPTWSHQGRRYVAGTPGERYSLRLTNRSAARVLAVVSVDGVNVISGDTAAPAQSGYVLDPGSSVDIRGWRKSMGEVAAFFFTALGDSYAARTGRPEDVGVIGVAAFRELPPPRPPAQPQRRGMLGGPAAESRADSEGSGEAARDRASASSHAPRAEEKLGTGHGEREASPVRWTQFRRAETPNELIAVHYDSRANLLARGIIREPQVPVVREPNPFPGYRFVPDPRG